MDFMKDEDHFAVRDLIIPHTFINIIVLVEMIRNGRGWKGAYYSDEADGYVTFVSSQ